MIHHVELRGHRRLTLSDYAADAKYVTAVNALRREVDQLRPVLEGRTLWMVNSTVAGGGVAEMLPRLCALLRQLGVDVQWAVIRTQQKEFFALTKRLHNLIHGETSTGIILGPDEAAVYEAVNSQNAASLRHHLRPQDVLIIHDPQPLPLGAMLKQDLGVHIVWQCHIGFERRTDATSAAWRFLQRYLEHYDQAIFSAAEYIPSFLAGRAAIVPPALDPMSHKNRDLLVNKLVGILCNSGLQTAHEPVITKPFDARVERIMPDGGVAPPGEVGLLFRPIVLQVSRWDRLKGWSPLLEGFLRLKKLAAGQRLSPRQARCVELARLVLAGPDPTQIPDDPQGVEVFRELVSRYRALDGVMQKDVLLLQLPMASQKENALIVNALQRCATIIVQNSVREGFGLTVTEAMWKSAAVLGTSACGIRQQIRDGIDGLLTHNAEDPDEIARHLLTLLNDPFLRFKLGRSAQLRVFDDFLIFKQISRYLGLLNSLLRDRPPGLKAAG